MIFFLLYDFFLKRNLYSPSLSSSLWCIYRTFASSCWSSILYFNLPGFICRRLCWCCRLLLNFVVLLSRSVWHPFFFFPWVWQKSWFSYIVFLTQFLAVLLLLDISIFNNCKLFCFLFHSMENQILPCHSSDPKNEWKLLKKKSLKIIIIITIISAHFSLSFS